MIEQRATDKTGMEKLVEGVRYFQSQIFESQRERFENLAKGQSPHVLLVTCSDSRINPHLITQTEPGDLFILRNAGNIVPPHGAAGHGGEESTIEYAVTALGIQHIIICGHSHCGAMKGLLHPESLTTMPSVANWLSHAEATRRVVAEDCVAHSDEQCLARAVRENVIVQMQNLLTYPSVKVKVNRDELGIHGWVYEIETGEVLAYDAMTRQFAPLVAQQLAIAEGVKERHSPESYSVVNYR